MSLVVQFLVQVRQLVRQQDGNNIAAWLQVRPDSAPIYQEMAAELRAKYPAAKGGNGNGGGNGGGKGDDLLDKLVENNMPYEDDLPEGQATVWAGLLAFMKDYFAFWRDVDYEKMVTAHQLLSSLVK